ncbi:MAG: hypothetical protein ABJF11_10710 [Reichenbachiella sp.]|uniref:hypothetical protein n=1 Tax=Reichenbachiella sp. TaxID=2184521 RepID=UPI0032637AB4
MANPQISGKGTYDGMEVSWIVWPANWGGTGSESAWKEHKWNNIGGLSTRIFDNRYQIRLHGANGNDPRVILEYSNFTDFNNAHFDFTGKYYQ